MGGAAQVFKPPKNWTPVYGTGKNRGLIGYKTNTKFGEATYNVGGAPTNNVAKQVAAADRAARYTPGGGGFDLFGGVIDAVNTNISTPLTQALQPVEKVANVVGSDPKALTAIALAVAIPGIGAAIGESLMAAGVVGGAEAASAAAIAAGATAAEAAAAGAAATATATTLGTAIASTAVQVAQGAPVDKAITNTLVNVGVSQVSPVVAQEINNFIGHPEVSNAITSAAASGVKTAAAGGSSEDITTAMTAGLAGSAANSAYSSAANDYNSTTGKVLGSATAGAITGGTAGALNNALTTAASSIGTPKPLGDISTKPVAAVDGGGGDAEVLPGQADSLGGAAPTPPIDATVNIPPSPVAGLDITQDESAAETARLAAKNAELAAATTTPAPVTRDQQILDLIATPSNVEPTAATAPTPTPPVVEPKQGAYLPEATPEPVPAPAPTPEPTSVLAPSPDQAILDLIAEKPATTDVAAVGDVPATPDKTPVTAPPVEAPVTAVEPPVEIDADIPRVEVSGVGNIEPPQGAYLPDTVPAESTAIEPAPVAEGYSTSMPDQSPAETARLAEKEQQILDLITPPPAPATPDIPAADPMSQDPAQKAQAAAEVPAVEVTPDAGTGLIDTPPVSDTDKQILDLISEEPTEDQSDAETERLARKEAELAGAEKGAYLPDSGTDTTPSTNTYKPTIFSVTDLSPKTRTAAPTSALGAALGTTGLTSYRGAGEIEGTGSGKPRKNVWNVESLKLKDALGV